ncbi:probable cytochrome P450 6a17 [Pseudomyrmex gracilis]|uniref:probable cytochrome P450 6a17 n=1 Tax=Pseudomyrmex gracilis TaxID=219809 RepID=UPI000994A153|nr:probable cytochrome P450 6a17 [Pseudomyrmex gracilis]
MEYLELLSGILVAILALYYYFTSTFEFWKSRGVPGPQPIPFFGNFKDIILSKKPAHEYLTNLYSTYKDEPMIGIFVKRQPILILKDPDLIKNVLIRDFAVFPIRRTENIFEKTEPLSQRLSSLEPKRWRPLRMRLSPVFTSGKLKEMFVLISKCADHLERHMEKLANTNEPVECRDLTSKYTVDVIGTCAFGVEMNALTNENSEFRKMARQLFASNWYNKLLNIIRDNVPSIYRILGYVLPQKKETKFFLRTTLENMEYRDKNNIVRHDFIDVLRDLKKHPEKIDNIELTDALLASQAFIFFIAGFETSSLTMSHALYELALNQKVQDKLREEIQQEYAKCDGDLTYENVKKLTYLDKVFKETLRKYTPLLFTMRTSTSSYTFDGTKVTIPKDQQIWIPIYTLQRDPSIYPDPDVFDPERFSEEAVRARHSMYFIPFGDGPRNCIGARFAIYQTKIGLVKMLRKYKFETCAKTDIPYKVNIRSIILSPQNGIHLKITKLDHS